MAFVTRCPYCGAVWLLPDKDTAERGPVRCSSCNHSFDATRALLCVNDAALPNLPESTLPKAKKTDDALVKPEADPAEATSFAPSFSNKRQTEKPVATSIANHVAPEPTTEKTAPVQKSIPVPDPKPEVPTPAVALDQAPVKPAAADNGLIHVKRSNEPKLSAVSGALQESYPGKTEPSLHIADIGQKKEPKLSGVSPLTNKPKQTDNTQSLGKIVPLEDADPEVRLVTSSDDESVHPAKPSRSYTGIVSVLLAVILLSILAIVSAIVFNQKILHAFPQTQEVFMQLCGKIPCPGFYIAQPEAFVVSKTTLRPVDESGNYTLDVTLVNGSNFAQAVPWLELELLDDNNGSLMKRTITPMEYLNDPQTTKSIPPNRSLTVRVSLQTNVTSARCVVKPTYPENK
ncbi:MAG: DUF3426 domain-containing protein [Sutterellaceae bacterium]|nr:DUF3426 domain-containing protein [Sutterellaceae bacterium]